MIDDQDLTIVAGDSKDVTCTIVDDAGAAKDLVGGTVTWTMYNGVKTVTKTVGSGIVLGAAGVFVLSLLPADTEDGEAVYTHQCRVVDANAKAAVVFRGTVNVLESFFD